MIKVIEGLKRWGKNHVLYPLRISKLSSPRIRTRSYVSQETSSKETTTIIWTNHPIAIKVSNKKKAAPLL